MNIIRNMTRKQVVVASIGVATFCALGTFAAAALASPTGAPHDGVPALLVGCRRPAPTFGGDNTASAPTQAPVDDPAPAAAPDSSGSSQGQPQGPAAQPAGPAAQPAGPAAPAPGGKNGSGLTLCLPCLGATIQPVKPTTPGGSNPVYVGGLGGVVISPQPVIPPDPSGIPHNIPKVPGVDPNPPLVPQGQAAPFHTVIPHLVFTVTN